MIIFPLDTGYIESLKKYEGKKTRGLKKALENPKEVKWLILRGNLMHDIGPIEIAKDFEKFSELEVLEFELYSSINWKNSLSKLAKLHSIIALGNEFAPEGIKLDKSLSEIPNLKALYIDNFLPLHISETFSSCPQLKTLWIEECKIKNIKELSKLTQLEELSLDNDPQTDLSCLTTLKNLKKLRLSISDQIPTWIQELSIKTLALLSYQLTELPDWLGGLESLEELDLRNCDIHELPKGFKNLKRLEIIGTPLSEKKAELQERFPDTEIITEH